MSSSLFYLKSIPVFLKVDLSLLKINELRPHGEKNVQVCVMDIYLIPNRIQLIVNEFCLFLFI